MPCRKNKSVKSLQECCIENVVNNIEKWCNQYVEKYGAHKLDHLDVDGPFDSLSKSIDGPRNIHDSHFNFKTSYKMCFQLQHFWSKSLIFLGERTCLKDITLSCWQLQSSKR